jgi:hypothetical protein
MSELKIVKLPDGSITLFTNREIFGHGREILITPEARTELMNFLFENYSEEIKERHLS